MEANSAQFETLTGRVAVPVSTENLTSIVSRIALSCSRAFDAGVNTIGASAALLPSRAALGQLSESLPYRCELGRISHGAIGPVLSDLGSTLRCGCCSDGPLVATCCGCGKRGNGAM